MTLAQLRPNRRRVAPAVVLLFGIPLAVYTFSSSPPLQLTGGFGEGNCTQCHQGTPVNGAPGSVVIGAPAFYVPGASMPVTVTIQDTSGGRQRWGFELSARFKDGRQAGSFTASPPVGVQAISGVQYATHQPAQSFSGSSFTYTVNWTAPGDAGGGDVVFNAAGNAANGDFTNGGDHIFTGQATAAAPLVVAVSSGGVVNGAAFVPAPNNTVAPGALISIFGSNLALFTAGAVAVPLPTTLGGTQVTVNGVAAPLVFVSPLQINAQAPFEAPAGSSVNVVVKVTGLPDSAAEPVRVEAASPGIFTASQNGTGAGAVLHANFSPVSSALPAKPGEVILIFCTGLGQTQPPVSTGAAGNGEVTASTPSVTVGGQTAALSFSGAAPGFVGLYQINVTVPGFSAAGDYEVIISIAGKQSRSGVTIRVQP